MRDWRVWLGLVFLGGLSYVLYLALAGMVGWLGRQDPATRNAVLGLAGVLTVPVMTFFAQRLVEQRKSQEEALRERRAKLYDEIVTVALSFVGAVQVEDQLERLKSLTPRIIMYGSPKFVRSFDRMLAQARRHTSEDFDSPWVSLSAVEELLEAVRADIGRSNRGLKPGDLLSVFITDVDGSELEQARQELKTRFPQWS